MIIVSGLCLPGLKKKTGFLFDAFRLEVSFADVV